MIPAATKTRTMRRLALLSAMLLIAAGCGGEDDTGDQASSQPTEAEIADDAAGAPEQSEKGPAVSVTADKTHAVQPGDEIQVTVSVENFTLSPDKLGAANEAGTGHYRLYLDDASGDNFLAESGEGTVTIKVPDSTTDGSHPLRAVLYNNDRTPLEPAVENEVWLIVYRL